ncbi:MAG TPA: PQQ-binding-like beta-propeller repeat protein [Chthonomonadales bacterium]|nr:PQQ-binding-like beta-propeller repeat protein [Chthonomonadales bacterium]
MPAIKSLSILLPILLCLFLPGFDTRAISQTPLPCADWPMRNANERRTGQSLAKGPGNCKSVWKYCAEGGAAINIEPTVTTDGVFFGTWGLVRRHGPNPESWDKMDGKLYGLHLHSGAQLWDPIVPRRNPYKHPLSAYGHHQNIGGHLHGLRGRTTPAQHRLNYYNGTVEGTPAYDRNNGRLYWGRGDGTLYAQDAVTGKLIWWFETIDPAKPGAPETGGEIVGGPVIGKDGVIFFATFAAPQQQGIAHHETNAVYAVSSEGRMLWRFPERGSLGNPFVAPIALSEDGTRLYAVTALVKDVKLGQVFALNAATGKPSCSLDLPDVGGQDLAVGKDGIVYIAGMKRVGFTIVPQMMALKDEGHRFTTLWGPILIDGMRSHTHFAGGLALKEEGNRVKQVLVSSTSLRNANSTGGQLHIMNPASGQIIASWNPQTATPPSIGGLTDVTVDRNGRLFVGVRGRKAVLRAPAHNGRMYALNFREGKFDVLWSLEVDGQIDWASPAVGPDGGLYFGSTAHFPELAILIPQDPLKKAPGTNAYFYGVHELPE